MLQNFFQTEVIEAGCDEAGRGCLAGPVYAAAVILPAGFAHPLLKDSKQMKEAERNEVRTYIEENALAYAVAFVTSAEIDEINILNASFKAMHLAIDALNITPDLLLIDGNRFNKYKEVKHECIIKGDGKYAAIAAASVLAKTYRDEFMEKIHEEYPEYGWNKNKGYGTMVHRQAMLDKGMTDYHRKTFHCKPKQLKLFAG